MKHLKKIDELYKSTLLNAHERLRKSHPQRASNLKKWADEKGKSDLSKSDADRLCPYGFILHDNDILKDVKDDFLSSFFITGIKNHENTTYSYIVVFMMNDYGQKIELVVKLRTGDYSLLGLYVKWGEKKNRTIYERTFLFERRKDAVNLRKFILEDGLQEMGIVDKEDIIAKALVVNNLYTTINDKKDVFASNPTDFLKSSSA